MWVWFDQILMMMAKQVINYHQVLIQVFLNPDWYMEVCAIFSHQNNAHLNQLQTQKSHDNTSFHTYNANAPS